MSKEEYVKIKHLSFFSEIFQPFQLLLSLVSNSPPLNLPFPLPRLQSSFPLLPTIGRKPAHLRPSTVKYSDSFNSARWHAIHSEHIPSRHCLQFPLPVLVFKVNGSRQTRGGLFSSDANVTWSCFSPSGTVQWQYILGHTYAAHQQGKNTSQDRTYSSGRNHTF